MLTLLSWAAIDDRRGAISEEERRGHDLEVGKVGSSVWITRETEGEDSSGQIT